MQATKLTFFEPRNASSCKLIATRTKLTRLHIKNHEPSSKQIATPTKLTRLIIKIHEPITSNSLKSTTRSVVIKYCRSTNRSKFKRSIGRIKRDRSLKSYSSPTRFQSTMVNPPSQRSSTRLPILRNLS